MASDVVRLELGPIGTNCYLVRRPGADEAVVADPAEGTGAPVHMYADEAPLLEHVNDYVPPGVRLRPYTPNVLLDGDESLELAGIAFQTLRVPGHSPAH